MAPQRTANAALRVTSHGVSRASKPAQTDAVDDLMDYDAGVDDVFRDLTPPRVLDARQSKRSKDALGLDAEVEVTRTVRLAKPKLDEERLLSATGIPKLRSRAKNLKLKGKGHEYSDIGRMLEMYQLWLDDLFPKARFLDALAMVEKQGHKRRMQSMRTQWIDESKPRPESHEEADVFANQQAAPGAQEGPANLAPIFDNAAPSATTPVDVFADDFEDDIYGATPRAPRAASASTGDRPAPSTSIFGPARSANVGEPEDELDAMLAEAEMMQTTTAASKPAVLREPDFDDEMEAMAEMEGGW